MYVPLSTAQHAVYARSVGAAVGVGRRAGIVSREQFPQVQEGRGAQQQVHPEGGAVARGVGPALAGDVTCHVVVER